MVISNSAFLGDYERRPVENSYHKVTIEIKDHQLIWRNDSVSWPLQLYNGKLWKRNKLKLDFNPSACKEKNQFFPSVFLEAEISSDRNFWSTGKPVRNTIRSSILASL